MLTIFGTCKPFLHEQDITNQMAAIKSWTLLKPKPQVILLGRDAGVSEVATRLDCLHARKIETSEKGTPIVGSLFAKARRHAEHDILAYVDADTMLLQDFIGAVKAVSAEFPRFLMIGRSWRMSVGGPLPVGDSPDWEEKLRRLATIWGAPRRADLGGTAFFVYSKGVYDIDFPLMYVGRRRWDLWLMGIVLKRGIPVVDVTEDAFPIHLEHREWDRPSEEVRHNVKTIGPGACRGTIQQATWALKNGRLERRDV